jgi:hypothetical protein
LHPTFFTRAVPLRLCDRPKSAPRRVAFGSEPIGDGVDGGIQQFTTDFVAFKAALKPFGIKASVSEDWDRWGSLLGDDGKLNADGQRLMDAQDLVHAHVMPYYAGDDAKNPSPTGGSAWGYVEHAVSTFLPSIAGGKKVMVTEMQWASALGPHGRDIGNSGAFWICDPQRTKAQCADQACLWATRRLSGRTMQPKTVSGASSRFLGDSILRRLLDVAQVRDGLLLPRVVGQLGCVRDFRSAVQD